MVPCYKFFILVLHLLLILNYLILFLKNCLLNLEIMEFKRIGILIISWQQ
ncbi:unnamed protein product [Meloidogyne enterolobii]|uniref:Uncharacterized protein n=1 Tax=Meloidogyne enterolobii TaxID=390850 RepID=A0ACB0YIE9_MELEN